MRVEQAFRPAVKIKKYRLQPLRYTLYFFLMTEFTAAAKADLCNLLTAGLKACSTLSMD
jgi:hypothetical protein